MHSYNAVLLCTEKEFDTQLLIHNYVGESQMHNAEWKKPDAKGSVLSDFIYTTFYTIRL